MKDPVIDEYEKLKRELRFEQVSKTIKESPNNWKQGLEMLGYVWCEDEVDEKELPIIENQRQQDIVNYLNGNKELEQSIVYCWKEEIANESPNYVLFREYFEKGNERLKQLLILAINIEPNNRDLLLALALFDEYKDSFSHLLDSYINALILESDLQKFEILVKDFLCNTSLGEEDNLDFLRSTFSDNLGKLNALNFLILQHQEQLLEDDIEF
jgi:hypothetical protein